MRVLITGSSGFIGRRLVACLRQAGMDCHGLSRERIGLPPGWEGTSFALVDLAWDTSRSAGFAAYARQAERLATLVEELTPLGLSHVIGTGSAEEYGAQAGVLAEEAEPIKPLTPYGWSKRATREMLQSLSLRTGLPCLWIRPFIVYGVGQTGNMLIPYAVRQGLSGQAADFSAGTQQRDLICVNDLVALYRAALERGWQGAEVVNAGRGEPVVLRDVLLHLANLLEARALFRLGARPDRPGEPDVQIAQVTRARALFNWEASVHWRDGLTRLVEWTRRGNLWAA